MRTLTPKDGYTLTNGIVYSTGAVYLGDADSPGNWWEIPVEDVPPEPGEDTPRDDDATARDYEAALNRLGVET